jgi:conjugative transfer signal peptidase TraF
MRELEHPDRLHRLPDDDGVQSWHPTRNRLERRFRMGVAAVGLLALTVLAPPPPLLVWNASASAPIGLYLITPGAHVARHNMVVAKIPDAWRGIAAKRHYLPENVPLVKEVAASTGDMACASGAAISVNGRLVGHRLRRDRLGRTLPWWEGCHRLLEGEILLLMRGQKASFDGRYFGVTRDDDVIGTAQLLWAR